MNKLELYAREKEFEFEGLLEQVVSSFNDDNMTDNKLKRYMKMAYKLGHHAGHCRGENHLNKLTRERLK